MLYHAVLFSAVQEIGSAPCVHTSLPSSGSLPTPGTQPAGWLPSIRGRGRLPLGVGTHGAQGWSRQRLRPGRTQVKIRPRTPDLETSGCHASPWKCTGSRKLRISVSLSDLLLCSPFPVYFLFLLDPSDQAPQICPFLVLSSPFPFNFQVSQKKYEMETCLIFETDLILFLQIFALGL